jgi:hypothetical protein
MGTSVDQSLHTITAHWGFGTLSCHAREVDIIPRFSSMNSCRISTVCVFVCAAIVWL